MKAVQDFIELIERYYKKDEDDYERVSSRYNEGFYHRSLNIVQSPQFEALKKLAKTPDSDGWIEWEATKDSVCPVPDGTLIEIKFKDGEIRCGNNPEERLWRKMYYLRHGEIIAYRIVEDKPENITLKEYASNKPMQIPMIDTISNYIEEYLK